ncbi:MAG: GLPGLI family protein [Bacteroidaceae bacterium]|nr:GLPGLI family protein [Bacteroidaceae bacterium]
MNLLKITFLALLCFSVHVRAQETHVIEPSHLEVLYKVSVPKSNSMFALRCGKNVCQYISLYRLRNDSLACSPDPVLRELHFKEREEQMDSDDPDKCTSLAPDRNDFLYRNLSQGRISVYTGFFWTSYLIEEDFPVIDWTICEDSTIQVLGYDCHKATAKFRGRTWTVWYTEDIPLNIGPWKLGGLPGLILKAKCDDYLTITAISARTTKLAPVTFYNFYEEKFQKIDRVKYLKIKTNPNTYPAGTRITPQMELE